MSHRANYWLAQLAPERVKPGAFRVLFHLCDHHNDERDPRRACFPSQETLRERTGMANGTLNAALAQLENDGLIRRIRSTVPGHAIRRTYYVLECDFDRIEEQTPKSGVSPNSGKSEAASEQTPVSEQANSGFEGSKLRPTGEEPVRNRKGKDVCAADAAQHTQSDFNQFWRVYPRREKKRETKAAFSKVVAKGADSLHIIAGATAYAEANDGNGWQYLAQPANWLKDRRWLDYASEPSADATAGNAVDLYAGMIDRGQRIFGGLAEEIERGLIERGYTPEQIAKAQVAI